MTTNWKELLQKRREPQLQKWLDNDEKYEAPFFEAYRQGHASLEPLLLKALEALERCSDPWDREVDWTKIAKEALAEIREELEALSAKGKE